MASHQSQRRAGRLVAKLVLWRFSQEALFFVAFFDVVVGSGAFAVLGLLVLVLLLFLVVLLVGGL